MDFKQFAKLMGQRADNLQHSVTELQKDVAQELLIALAETTPVDTGNAVSNYQVGINGAVGTPIGPHVPGKRQSTRGENIRATISNGSAILDTVGPGDSIHITNNTDYIRDLDRGTSAQAPTGMSKQAIARARKKLIGVKLLGKPYVRST